MPLTIESFAQGGAEAAKITATRVVVRDAHGNPILLAVEHEPGVVLCAHENDPDFGVLLATFGLDRGVVVRRATVGG